MVRQVSPHHQGSGPYQDREGVSLLETMVAMTLAMVMLGAIWSLANLLTRRHETQIRLAEQSQIIRSLHQRLTQDLNSLVNWNQQPPPPSEPSVAAGESLLPVFPFYQFDNFMMTDEESSSVVAALTGTETELSLHVYTDPIELAWRMVQAEDREYFEESRIDTNSPPPGLARRVRYALRRPVPHENADSSKSNQIDPDPPSEEAREPLVGFIREEWENAAEANSFERRGTEFDSTFAQSSNANPGRSFGGDEGDEFEFSGNHRIERIEEIEDVQFRYFDGRRWRRRWDTLQDGRLPHAILFQFNFAPRKSRREDQKRETFPEFSDDKLQVSEFENEFEDLEFGELPTDERFEFAFLLRILTPMSRPGLQLTPSGLDLGTSSGGDWGNQQ